MKKTTTFIALLLCLTHCLAQKNELSLLNDRFYLTFPDSAKNTPRNGDIMSADPNKNSETRIIYDSGDKRIVFFAEDLNLKSVPDLQEKLKKEVTSEYAFSVETIFDKDSVKCILVTPAAFDNNSQAILVNYLVITNPDNTMSRVSVYLNPAAYNERPFFDSLITRTIKTFRKGKRRLNLSARTESFPVLGTATKMELKVPANYVFTIDKKYDFEVYKLTRVTNYGDYNDMSELILYFGFHPSMLNIEMAMDKYKVSDSDGEFMIQKMKWQNFEDTLGGLILREQVFVDDDIQKDAKIHIAMIATKPTYINELTEAIKGSLLKYKK